ncbi:50S ribosomal protein L19 [Candidatus Woesebacteria bacterium]|nr:50S ribosomal protein L19 [Candidatus Woesebacteria bacterium]
MANSVSYNDTVLHVGDEIAVDYKFKEGDKKERIQRFKGILIKVKGASDTTRMITVRKIAKDGTGVERIIPLNSPFVDKILVTKESSFSKARAYFVRDLSQKKTRQRLYRAK